jgi:hypothetical protein
MYLRRGIEFKSKTVIEINGTEKNIKKIKCSEKLCKCVLLLYNNMTSYDIKNLRILYFSKSFYFIFIFFLINNYICRKIIRN